ncbi:MAG: elongation factor Ts [Lachnospiraceae bacterium]|nr:elongation factor Ts [Lachnospiraceae bacterium]
MATITAAMVKELREISGAGMMDCKKALTECDGNMDAAVEALRKSGAMKAEKKASRIAAEGICRIAKKEGKAVVVEVNSETDFVAKNEIFQTFVEKIADQVVSTDVADVDALLASTWMDDTTKTVNDALVEKVATIGEKLSIRRFEKVEAPIVVGYLHGGGRIGVIVGAEGAKSDATEEALTNIAMQIAAMNPQYASRDEISADELAKMKEITIDSALNDPASLPKPILNKLIEKALTDNLWSAEDKAIYEEKKSNMNFLFNFLSKEAIATLAQLAMAGKADYITDKIFSGLVEGRISKQIKDICLMDQIYVKAEDGKVTVAQYLKSVSADLKVVKFVRFETGEGMEKKEEDFAAEVAKQMAGN